MYESHEARRKGISRGNSFPLTSFLILSRWFDRSGNVFGLISKWVSNIGMWFTLLLAITLTVDVIFRFAFNRPFKGVSEICALMMIIVVFLGVAYVQYTKSNISVALLYSRFPEKLQAVIDVFLYPMNLGIWSIIAWRAFVHWQYLVDVGQVTDVRLIPVAPFQMVLAIGCVMLSIVLLFDFINSVLKVVKIWARP